MSKSSLSKEDENNKDDSISKNSNKDVNKSRIKKKYLHFIKTLEKIFQETLQDF